MKRYLRLLWQKSGRKEFTLLAGVVAVCLFLWMFLWIADEVGEADHLPLEEWIMCSLRRTDDPGRLRGPAWMNQLARAVTELGGAAAITIATGLTLGSLLLKRRVRLAVFILVSVAGGLGLSGALKHAFDRTRPDVVPRLMPVSTPSFPSGHTMSSAVVYVTIGALLVRGLARWRDKVLVVGCALLLTTAVGLSRVALGVHYPSDVLAGWVAGTGWALVCWTAGFWLSGRTDVPGTRHKKPGHARPG